MSTPSFEAPNPLLHLFNPVIPFLQTKRARGRPCKKQPPMPIGHTKHILHDDEALVYTARSKFPRDEQVRFRREYDYEVIVEGRTPKAVLEELAPLYGIEYKAAHAFINPT